MEKTKHTPTPWTFSPEVKVIGNDLLFESVATIHRALLKKGVYEANGKRIVECVNAMEGIEEPAEFMDIVKTIITAIQEGTELKPDSLVVQAVAAAIK
jgi:hypothetical protein